MNPGTEGNGHGRDRRVQWRRRIKSGAWGAVRFLLGHSRARAWLVSNQTNRRLKIRRPSGRVLTLSPLERARPVSALDVEAFGLRGLQHQGTLFLQLEPNRWVHRLAFLQSLTGKLSLLAFSSSVTGAGPVTERLRHLLRERTGGHIREPPAAAEEDRACTSRTRWWASSSTGARVTSPSERRDGPV